jgi:hypothetical protein
MKSSVTLLLYNRTVNLPLFIMVHAFFAVHYVIQTVLHYWAPRPLYSLDGILPQPMTNGFIPNPLLPMKSVAHVMPHRNIIERLWLFAGGSWRRLKCKSGPEEHSQSVPVTKHFQLIFLSPCSSREQMDRSHGASVTCCLNQREHSDA